MFEWLSVLGLKNLALSTSGKMLLSMGALAGTSYLAYRSLPQTKVRRRLQRVFKAGDLVLYRDWRGQKIDIYPTITHLRYYQDHSFTLHFSVPVGLSLDKVEKALWCFHQEFGKHLELKKENQAFILSVFSKKLPFLIEYDAEKMSPYLLEKKLPIIVGYTHQGHEVYDMVKYPHLCLIGDTGSGKSTQLRAILTGLIQSKSDSEVELYLADLKKIEFHLFRGVKQVKEIVHTANDLYSQLVSLKRELDIRSNLLEQYEVTTIEELPFTLPYLCLCVDDVALLKNEKSIMERMDELVALGRPLGVFLILSVQRPEDLADTKLASNMGARMVFRLADEESSIALLGKKDAAKIKMDEKGRMYYKIDKVKMVQGPFLPAEKTKVLLRPFREGEQVVQTHLG